MRRKITICFIGCGRFAPAFVPLFKVHPDVEKVYVCDIRRERAEDFSRRFGVDIIDSLEDALARPDINSIAIFTERQKHGPIAIAALKAGKHVYSAVPCAVDVEDIMEIERLVRQKRLTYSMGETGYYRAATIFCRKEFKKGSFGKFVYGEAQYNHDIRNMEFSFRSSSGERWKEFAGIPPFFYPTHSTSMILGAMPGVRALTVSAQGYRPETYTDIFGAENQNVYQNPFGNTAMLLTLSNGGVARISENRVVGWKSPETYISQFQGTDGCYEFAVASHYFAKWNPDTAKDGRLPDGVTMQLVNDQLLPPSICQALKENMAEGIQKVADGMGFRETSPIQPIARLPKEFEGYNNGHNGTHHFLVDDFCRAMAEDKLSPTNIWQTARFNIPGLIAHQSALKGGEVMQVPDLGEPPADWELLNPDGDL